VSLMLAEHHSYLSDSIRLKRFKSAIERIVKPGDRVVDVGCGFGVLGLLCLRAGAARVWGIESTGAIEIARESLARAGLGDRYVCIRGKSHHIDVPEPVDVVICDHVGCFGFDYEIIDTLQDARKRFLKPGGKIVPSCIKLLMGAIESADCRKAAEAWSGETIPVEYHWLREYGINTKYSRSTKGEELLSEPATLGTIDLGADNADFLSFETELRVSRDGVVDGLAGWFECELAEGIWMTNSPCSDSALQRNQVFLPVDQSLDVKSGERLKISVMTRPIDGIISWSIEAPSSGSRFAHSTWKSLVLTGESIMRSQPDRVPRLSRLGQARKIVLEFCDGKRTIREIEQAVLREHPHLLPSRSEISRFVFVELGRSTE
jgi:2-polyprenyl-3-methyl-5-hydroxy-6-metoxy-1,4-benzoquinol methylase